MKQIITESLNKLLKHRRLLVLLVMLLLLTIGVVVFMAVTIQVSSDLKIITHYTAYGIMHFYRDSWIYLFSFIAFAILSAVFSIVISIKLLSHDRENLAILLGWIGVTAVCLTLVTYIHLIGLM